MADSHYVQPDSPRVVPPRKRISWPDICQEAMRNLLSGTAAAGLAILIFVLTIGGLAGWRAAEMAGISIAAQRFQLAGGSTFQLSAEKGIDPDRCLSLAGVGTIRDSAALRSGPKLSFAVLAGRTVATLEGFGDFGKILYQSAPNSYQLGQFGAWISIDLARDLGLVNSVGHRNLGLPSQVELISGETLPIAGIFGSPSDGRQQSLGYTAILPVLPNGVFDACWANIWPNDQTNQNQLRLAVDITKFAGKRDEIRVDQLNSSLGISFWPVDKMRENPSRFAPGIALILGAFGGAAYIWRRRLEFASALHAGLDQASLIWLVVVELTTWLSFGIGVSLPLCYWLAVNQNPDPWLPAAQNALNVLVLGAAGTLIGAISTLASIRERQLFVLFKQRS